MSNKPFKVLLVEKDDQDKVHIGEMLNKSEIAEFELIHTQRLESALVYVNNEKFDIILLDLCLPDCVGLNSFKAILNENHNIPIVLLNSLANEDMGIEAIKYGAQDYLVKGEFNGKLLARSLQYAIERKKIEGLFNY